MDAQQCLVVGVSSQGRPIERTIDRSFVVDYGELVVDLVTARKATAVDPQLFRFFDNIKSWFEQIFIVFPAAY